MALEPGAVAQKWASRVRGAQADYVAGVQGKGSQWFNNALQAESSYAEGVQRAIATGARSRGIQAAGAAKWEQAVTTKGPQNWVTGVTSPTSMQAYQQNFAPILSAISSAKASLPPRGPPMSEQNMARFQQIITAVHNAAQARGAGQQVVQPLRTVY